MKTLLQILFILVFTQFINAQNKVSFRVTDESGEPLIGAAVLVKNSLKGTITDAEGKAFIDELPEGKTAFEISFMGYEKYAITLVFPDENNKLILVQLEEATEELDEIRVSTTRSSRTIQDIPTRIEAITSEELGEKAAMNSSNIGMLLKETSGVQMQQTSLSSGNLSIKIQGLDGRYTQILKDGFPLFGGFAGGLSIMQIPPLDLKQVELIKGGNSTLYGGGAIAGIVNLITILPEDKPELNVMFNQTSAKGTTANFFYAQKYGKTGFSLYGSGNYQFADDTDDDGFSNLPNAKTFNLNPKFFYYINPKTELNFGINASIDNREGGDMEVLKDGKNDMHQFEEVNASERYSTQLLFKNSTENHTLTAKNSIAYFYRNLTVPDYEFEGTQYSGFSEVMYNLHPGKERDWQFGANHYFEKFTETPNSRYPVRDYTHSTIGAFVQNTTEITPKFIFEGGFRTDYNADYGAFYLPRIALLFKPGKSFTARLGGALGYKLPTMFTEDAERLYYRDILPVSSELVQPETSAGGNFDMNYRTSFSDDFTFSVNQMFFVTQLKNALVLRENAGENSYFFENADGNILSSGFETNMKFGYNDFKFYLNYAFIHAELKYDNINNQKPLTPKHNLGMVLFYEIEGKWSVGYETYYTGSQFDEFYSSKQGFWTMGAMVMRYFERVSLFANFENFTNVMQSDFEPLVLPPVNMPTFNSIWAPTDGFVFNAGIKFKII